jgi:hypothetical protein
LRRRKGESGKTQWELGMEFEREKNGAVFIRPCVQGWMGTTDPATSPLLPLSCYIVPPIPFRILPLFVYSSSNNKCIFNKNYPV